MVVEIHKIKYSGKRSFPWEKVKHDMSALSGKHIIVQETGDEIILGSRFSSEYCGSVYTKRLHGTLEKAKANAGSVIEELIKNATNRRWIENKKIKHCNDAGKGWYRYDVYFSMPIVFAGEESVNYYRGTLLARINDKGIYLHDLINIKKEDSKPFESKDRTD